VYLLAAAYSDAKKLSMEPLMEMTATVLLLLTTAAVWRK
jgi:hypothetical protein